MKKLLSAIILGLALAGTVSAQTVTYPERGGTGTTTTPSLGQILVGQSNGTYGPQATSTLGLVEDADLAAYMLTSAFPGLFDARFAATTTTGLAEGSNLYWTNSRFDTRLAATTTLNNITTLGSLSLPLTQTTGTLSVSRGGTGQTSFGQGWLNSNGTTISASTSPTVPYITATSTVATSTLPNAKITRLEINGESITDLTGSGLSIVDGALTATSESASTTLDNIFINVTDYGAVGDGVTDSTVALSNAYSVQQNASTTGCMILPPGEFVTSLGFNGTEKQCIIGTWSGLNFQRTDPYKFVSRIIMTSNNTPIITVDSDGDRLENFAVKYQTRQGLSDTNAKALLFLTGATRGRFHNLAFENVGWGMYTSGGESWQHDISNMHVLGFSQGCIYFDTSATSVTISQFYCQNGGNPTIDLRSVATSPTKSGSVITVTADPTGWKKSMVVKLLAFAPDYFNGDYVLLSTTTTTMSVQASSTDPLPTFTDSSGHAVFSANPAVCPAMYFRGKYNVTGLDVEHVYCQGEKLIELSYGDVNFTDVHLEAIYGQASTFKYIYSGDNSSANVDALQFINAGCLEGQICSIGHNSSASSELTIGNIVTRDYFQQGATANTGLRYATKGTGAPDVIINTYNEILSNRAGINTYPGNADNVSTYMTTKFSTTTRNGIASTSQIVVGSSLQSGTTSWSGILNIATSTGNSIFNFARSNTGTWLKFGFGGAVNNFESNALFNFTSGLTDGTNKATTFGYGHYNSNVSGNTCLAYGQVSNGVNDLSLGGGGAACLGSTVVRFFTSPDSTTLTGTEKMRITSAGLVGIGTTTPYAKLSVVGQTVSEYFTSTSTTATSTFPKLTSTYINLGSDTINDFTGTGLINVGGALTLDTSASGLWATTSANWNFGVNLSATTTLPNLNVLTGLATIGSTSGTTTFAGGAIFNGNVGIGTTTALAKLQIVDNSTAAQIWSNSAAGANMKDWRLGFTTTSMFLGTLNENSSTFGDAAITIGRETSSNDVDYIGFAVNNEVNKMRFTNAGNLGIGTTTPQSTLSVAVGSIAAGQLKSGLILGGSHAAASGGTSIDFQVNGISNNMSRIGSVIGPVGTEGELVFYTTSSYSGISPTEKLRINGAGNIGIGTTSPYAKLSVVGQAVAQYFTATSTTATSTMPHLSATAFALGSDYVTDLTGTGLTIVDGVLTAAGTSNWATTSADYHFDTRLAATTTLNNLTTLRGLTDIISTRATTTNATSTNFFATTASTTNLFVGGSGSFGTTSQTAAITIGTESGNPFFIAQRRGSSRLEMSTAGATINFLSASPFRFAPAFTDGANKTALLGFGGYDSSTEELNCFALGQSSLLTNDLGIGGGAGNCNAMTVIRFYTASTPTTTTGVLAGTIDSSGNWTLGSGTAGTERLTVKGNVFTHGIVTASSFTATSTTDSVLPRYTGTFATTTNATSTNFFATTASTTNLYAGTGLSVSTTSQQAAITVQVTGGQEALFLGRAGSASNLAVTFEGSRTNLKSPSGFFNLSNSFSVSQIKQGLITVGNYDDVTYAPRCFGGAQDTGAFGPVFLGGGFTECLAATSISLYTSENASSTVGSLAMRILGNGNVGIGASIPTTKLFVAGTTTSESFVATSTVSTSTLPLLSSTIISSGTICLAGDCRTAWPGAGSSSWSTTSADYWLTQNRGAAFSTTSADAWDATKSRWATTSDSYAFGVNLSATTTLPNLNVLTGLATVGSSTGTTTFLGGTIFNGNVGIGTAAPTQILNVYRSGASTNVLIQADSNQQGALFLGDTTTALYRPVSTTRLSLYESSAERLTVSGGNVGIGTTSPWRTFSTNGTIAMNGLTTTTGTPSSICQNATTKEVTVNAATSCLVSDEDQKTPLKPLDFSALEKIRQITPSSFAYNDRPDRLRYGFGAQSLQKVDPQLGDAYDKDGVARSIDIPALIALNTKAIQELDAKVGESTEPREGTKWPYALAIGLLSAWNIALTFRKK